MCRVRVCVFVCVNGEYSVIKKVSFISKTLVAAESAFQKLWLNGRDRHEITSWKRRRLDQFHLVWGVSEGDERRESEIWVNYHFNFSVNSIYQMYKFNSIKVSPTTLAHRQNACCCKRCFICSDPTVLAVQWMLWWERLIETISKQSRTVPP